MAGTRGHDVPVPRSVTRPTIAQPLKVPKWQDKPVSGVGEAMPTGAKRLGSASVGRRVLVAALHRHFTSTLAFLTIILSHIAQVGHQLAV